jgi:hypothetical protein
MDRYFILESIGDRRGEDLAKSLAEHAKDVSWVESEDRNICNTAGGYSSGYILNDEIKGTKGRSAGHQRPPLNSFYNYISRNNVSYPVGNMKMN